MSVHVERVAALPDGEFVMIDSDDTGNTTVWMRDDLITTEGAGALALALTASRRHFFPRIPPPRACAPAAG